MIKMYNLRYIRLHFLSWKNVAFFIHWKNNSKVVACETELLQKTCNLKLYLSSVERFLEVTLHHFIQALSGTVTARRVCQDPAVHYGGARWSFKLWGLFNVSGNLNAVFVHQPKGVAGQEGPELLPVRSSSVVVFILNWIRSMADPPDH